jgi:O-succinylbenzoic acid--CoA ligase
LLTQDRGVVEADGQIRVHGRCDRVAVSGGVNVPLDAVEARLRTHPAVLEACVIAVPDPIWGSRLAAVVAATAPTGVVDAWARVHLPPAWRPRCLVRVSRLPRTPLGKIDLEAARRLVLRSG